MEENIEDSNWEMVNTLYCGKITIDEWIEKLFVNIPNTPHDRYDTFFPAKKADRLYESVWRSAVAGSDFLLSLIKMDIYQDLCLEYHLKDKILASRRRHAVEKLKAKKRDLFIVGSYNAGEIYKKSYWEPGITWKEIVKRTIKALTYCRVIEAVDECKKLEMGNGLKEFMIGGTKMLLLKEVNTTPAPGEAAPQPAPDGHSRHGKSRVKKEEPAARTAERTLEDLFYKAEHIEPCLDILRNLDKPAIDGYNNFIGKPKGIVCVWRDVLLYNRPHPIIKDWPNKDLTVLFNSTFPGLNMEESTFRKPNKRAEMLKLEIIGLLRDVLLSQDSHSGK